jgi:hypothetical protein
MMCCKLERGRFFHLGLEDEMIEIARYLKSVICMKR